MKKKNIKSLDAIAVEINQLTRRNIIDIGELLLEAKDQCEHGDWLEWLDSEFDWSPTTADRYMKAATLSSKFPNLKNLNIAATTIYALADREDDDQDLSAIIDKLATHATAKRLRACDAERIIEEIEQQRLDAEREAEAAPQDDGNHGNNADGADDGDNADDGGSDDNDGNSDTNEAISILDGAPPDLPLPITPPEPQRFGADIEAEWAEAEPFSEAITTLLDLHTKPVARFAGVIAPEELRAVIDFPTGVMTAEAKDRGQKTKENSVMAMWSTTQN
jgi:hypothetical protein